jgi:hypothetical protein
MTDFINRYMGKRAVASQQKEVEAKSHDSFLRRAQRSIKPLVEGDFWSQSEREESTSSLIKLSNDSAANLLSVRTAFPFMLFADTLKIDKQKLTVVHNKFLRSSQTSSIRLKDLRNVQTVLGPIFGSIILTSQHFLNNTQTLNFLRRKDAIYAQRLLQGFMVAHDAGIDTNEVEEATLLKLLNKIGKENI